MNITEQKITEEFRNETIKRVTWVGLLSNVVLSILKCILGYFGSSQAVIADGVHSLSDLTTDLAILIGIKYWSAPPDPKHPYGHHRLENIVTVFIGGILISVAIGISYNSIYTLTNPEDKLTPTWLAAVAALISIIVKELLYRWTAKEGDRVNSPSLRANAIHHRSDSMSSIPTLIAVCVASLSEELKFVDQLGALIVSVFILKTGFEVIKESMSCLIDTSATEEDQSKIMELTLAIDGVKSAHKVRTRKVAYGTYADLHIQVNGDLSVTVGHDISEEVKKILLQNGPNIIDVIVHLEPY